MEPWRCRGSGDDQWYDLRMRVAREKKVIEEALRLPAEARAALAGSLLVWGMATGQVSWHPRGPTDRETVEQLAALAIPLQAGLSVVASLDLLSRYTPPALRRPWRLA